MFVWYPQTRSPWEFSDDGRGRHAAGDQSADVDQHGGGAWGRYVICILYLCIVWQTNSVLLQDGATNKNGGLPFFAYCVAPVCIASKFTTKTNGNRCLQNENWLLFTRKFTSTLNMLMIFVSINVQSCHCMHLLMARVYVRRTVFMS